MRRRQMAAFSDPDAFCRNPADAFANGDALPTLGAPVLINLSLQSDVTFPHPPGRTGKANPAYAAVVKLGAEPAATYQVTVSGGGWVDVVENGDLVKPTDYVRAKDCPGVDKSIRFKTSGGPLAIQISGSYAKTIKRRSRAGGIGRRKNGGAQTNASPSRRRRAQSRAWCAQSGAPPDVRRAERGRARSGRSARRPRSASA